MHPSRHFLASASMLRRTAIVAVGAAAIQTGTAHATPTISTIAQTAPTAVAISVEGVDPGPIYAEFAHAAETYATVKDRYVTSGLIAMWDGEDNQGTGVHDAGATTWVDLAGNHAPMEFRANPTVNARSYYVGAGGGCVKSAADIAAAINAEAATVEIVCNVRAMVDNASLFACVDGDSGNRIAWVRTSTASGMKGIVGAAEYKSISYYSPYPAFDQSVGAVRSYTFTYSADACRVYKDGSATAAASVANKGVGGNTATAAFSVGQRISQNGGFSAAVADMDVYCVRVYSRVLDPDEIAANHAQDVKRFYGAAHAVDLDAPGKATVLTNLLGTATAEDGGAATFALIGLRPDVADYTLRVFAEERPSEKSAPVSFSTASEREASAWFEYLDSNDPANQSLSYGAAINIRFASSGRVPVVRMKFQMLSATNSRFAFGAYNQATASGTSAGIFNNKFRYRAGSDAENSGGYADMDAAAFTAVHELELNGPDGTILDGDVLSTSISGLADDCPTSWCLFGRRVFNASTQTESTEYANVRMWTFRLWANGALVRDMVPARHNGVAGMLDRAGNVFYGSYGTRPFIVGPMRSAPTLADVAVSGRTVSATLTRTGTDASAVSVAYGAGYGGGEPQAWGRFEPLATGFAEGETSLEVSLARIPRDARYVRFLSREDGWCDTVYLPDFHAEQPFVMVIR